MKDVFFSEHSTALPRKFTVEKINDEIVKKVETFNIQDFIKISINDGSNKFCIMPKKFVDVDIQRIKNMKIYEDDVWIVTFPKCGTTWSQEMIWMVGHDLDYETSSKIFLENRFPFLELTGIAKKCSVDGFKICENFPRPRYIKSHLPMFLLPDELWTVKPKIVYVARNAKDTAVSYYHHHIHFHCYKGTKDDYFEAFLKDLVLYSPMNGHILDFWKIRNEPNILFLFYEDMKRDLDREVKKTMKFLGKNYSQDQIDKLCKHLSFESIKENKMVNKCDIIEMIKGMNGEKYDPAEFNFVRKGQVGSYKMELTPEENEMLDKYVDWPEFKQFGFEYKF